MNKYQLKIGEYKLKIKDDVLQVLRSSKVDEDNNILFLPATQLDRKLYIDVNKCLESLGGKWNKKSKGHVFDSNPSDGLDEMINTGEWTDAKKEFQYFPTPKNIVKKMIELAEINSEDVILEPSAGRGAIADEFPKENPITLIELMPENFEKLKEKGYENVHLGDFLQSTTFADKIIMNPPFTKHQDVKHIFHAWECLKSGGRLVSVVSESPFFRENSLSAGFRSWLEENNAEVIELESGDFKESGTMVKTRIIVVDKK